MSTLTSPHSFHPVRTAIAVRINVVDRQALIGEVVDPRYMVSKDLKCPCGDWTIRGGKWCLQCGAEVVE